MSCMWCARFSRSYDDVKDLNGEEYLRAVGECTLNPIRVKVSGAHVCSSFLWERVGTINEHTPIASWWLSSGKENVASKALKKEIKRLKEANKTLREKLKAKE